MVRDLVAQELISTTVRDDQIVHIRSCETAAQMWQALTIIHQPSNALSGQFSRKTLYHTEAEEDTDIPVHLNKLSTMRQMMTANGDHVPDKEFKDILLNSLPPSWKPYTASFLGFSNSSHEHGSTTSALTVQQIISILSRNLSAERGRVATWSTLLQGQAT